MIFVVQFEDNISRLQMRPLYMEAHLTFLDRHSSKIETAGSLVDASTRAPDSRMWVVEAGNVGEVQALVKADPFWTAGLRQSYQIFEWKRSFAHGEILI